MDAIWVVLLSTVVPALIVLAGRWLDKRRGVPASVDLAIDSHVQFVVDALNDEIELRKRAQEDCTKELAVQREQIANLVHDKDLLQAQVTRLLVRLNGSAA